MRVRLEQEVAIQDLSCLNGGNFGCVRASCLLMAPFWDMSGIVLFDHAGCRCARAASSGRILTDAVETWLELNPIWPRNGSIRYVRQHRQGKHGMKGSFLVPVHGSVPYSKRRIWRHIRERRVVPRADLVPETLDVLWMGFFLFSIQQSYSL